MVVKTSKFDWEKIKSDYITGNRTLESFSREKTGNNDNPAFITLKTRCARENWTKLREEYQHNLAYEVAQKPEVQAVIERTEEVLKTAEIIKKHLRIAALLERIGEERLNITKPDEINYKEALASIELGTSIEQNCIKYEDIATALDVVIRAGYTVIDPSENNSHN